MADAYLGQIMLFAGDFAPRKWMKCEGQKLSIPQNNGLYSLLGVSYGGDGFSYFNLPNLKAITVDGASVRDGLVPGAFTGTRTVTLQPQQLAQHNHKLLATQDMGDSISCSGTILAASGSTSKVSGEKGLKRYSTNPPGTTLMPDSLGLSGGGGAHNNMQPYLVLTFCICIDGLFPNRP